MKKMLVFFVSLVSMLFISGIFAVPSMAINAFAVNVIKCGPPTSVSGCGLNTATTEPLIKGRVKVDDSLGLVIVKLRGARPTTQYTVFVGNWVRNSSWQSQFAGTGPCGSVGTVTTNVFGNFNGTITKPLGGAFTFPPGTDIGQPNFAFNFPACFPTHFTTGFRR